MSEDPDGADQHTVVDRQGYEKEMVGWPVGVDEQQLPTGEPDLDWRCPCCKRVGSYSTRSGETRCHEFACPVKTFSPFQKERYDDR